MPSANSAIRRGLIWWFSSPESPYVSASGIVDFQPGLDYLAKLKADGASVTVQHLVCGAVASALKAWPVANARVIGRRVQQFDHVGVAMPVNLIGHAGGDRMELSMAVIEKAEERSLLDLSALTRRTVEGERTGKPQNPFLRGLLQTIEGVPDPLLFAGLDALDWAARRRVVARWIYDQVPVTTALTNPGSAVGEMDGLLFRGVAVNIPTRLVAIGTLWGLSAMQREVLPIGGRPMIRPALPFVMVFDHRLFDGFLATKIARHVSEVLLDPANAFGQAGDKVPAP